MAECKFTQYVAGYTFKLGSTVYCSGNTPSAYRSNYEGSFDIVEELEGKDAYVKYWTMEYVCLDDAMKSIIEAVLGDVQVRILTENLRLPKKLIDIAINKLAQHGEKHMKTCSRCGGTGHYSYNQMYGTTCFKCNGMKYLLPTERQRTKKWFAQVKETFTQES